MSIRSIPDFCMKMFIHFIRLLSHIAHFIQILLFILNFTYFSTLFKVNNRFQRDHNHRWSTDNILQAYLLIDKKTSQLIQLIPTILNWTESECCCSLTNEFVHKTEHLDENIYAWHMFPHRHSLNSLAALNKVRYILSFMITYGTHMGGSEVKFLSLSLIFFLISFSYI